MVLFGSLIGYISSIEQIFADVFHRPELMTTILTNWTTNFGRKCRSDRNQVSCLTLLTFEGFYTLEQVATGIMSEWAHGV